MFGIFTSGIRVSSCGLYKTQIIDFAVSLSKYEDSVCIISILPYFNRDLLKYKLKYEHYLQSIRLDLASRGICLRIIRLPLPSHCQYIQFRPFLFLWVNKFLLSYLRSIFRSFGIKYLYCRHLLASMIAVRSNCSDIKCINYDIRGNDIAESPFFPFHSIYNQQVLSSFITDTISRSTKTSCVNQVISDQLNLSSSNNLVYNIPSSLISDSISKFSSINEYLDQVIDKPNFLFIGSLGMTWYPFSEFLVLYRQIKSLYPTAIFTILAPDFLHSGINYFVSTDKLDVVLVDSFNSIEEALAKSANCHFGILPHISPRSYSAINNLDITDLCAGVTSTKLSDYICLNLIPVVPDWCTAASEIVLKNNIGFVYGDSNVSNMHLIRDRSTLVRNLNSIQLVKNQFTIDYFSKSLRDHIID